MTDNNKRIAKNTLLLYFRMFFMMAINLYTSRIVLNTLGIEDYGIQNVVGGVITMLSFLTNSLGAATSRFITYDLGKNDINNLKNTFGNILSIHILLSILILTIGETIGLYFLKYQLTIPTNRIDAAFWVYQFSVFSSILAVLSVPYNAIIIAHEKMGAFAYITIIDAILKLLIVYLLIISPLDKLVTYSFFLFLIQSIDRLIYSIYCKSKFIEAKAKPQFDKKIFRNILSFAGWTMNGNLAIIGYTQGLNILLNIFFGPAINAARGIAVQVQNVIRNFCNNFQMALNPQITKSFAKGDLTNMHNLIIVSSKFSFYLLFLLSLPIMLEAQIILNWWLGIIPNHTIIFLRLILCSCMLIALSNPIIISIHATGKIKKFQLIEGSMLLTIVPIAYILLKIYHLPPESVFVTHIIIEILTQYIRLKIVLPLISMDINSYANKVVTPIIKVISIASIPSILISHLFKTNEILHFIITIFSTTIFIVIAIYWGGCNGSERTYILNKLKVTYCNLSKIIKERQ